MVKSVVHCSQALIITTLFSLTGCTSQDTVGFGDKAVSVDLVEPACAEPGAAAGYIEGNGFGAENVTITVGGIEAQVLNATGADASFIIPENVPPGPIKVIVTNPGGRIGEIDWVTCITDSEVARIEVAPSAAVITDQGGTYQFTATAYNAADQPVPADFVWQSRDPGDVELVDQTGLVMAMVPIGSAQIVAEADGVTSPPAIVTIAQPVEGATLVADWQVVEGPSYDGDPETFDVGSLVQVTLEGIGRPALGDIILPLETLSVGGRVAEVEEPTPGVFAVALEILPIDEMYEAYSVDETFDLSELSFEIGEQVAALYDLEVQPDGTFLFTPKPDAILPKQATGTRALGPFKCTEIDEIIGVPLTLNALPPSLSIKPNLSFITKWDDDPTNEDRIAFKGSLTGRASVGATFTQSFSGRITCSGELVQIRIPVFGIPLLSGGGFVPLGVGLSVGGNISVANVGFTTGATVTAELEAGIRRLPNSFDAEPYVDGQPPDPTFFYTPSIPDLDNPTSQFRIGLDASTFGFAELVVGVELFGFRLGIQTLRLQVGPSLSGTFGTIEGQLIGPFKSSYKRSVGLTLKLGADVEKVLKVLNTKTQLFEFSVTSELGRSPTLRTAIADTANYQLGDTVTFSVELNPEDLNFIPLVYNIDEVLIYETETASGSLIATQVASVTPTASGQSDFTLQWTPSRAGSIGDNFFAMVDTGLLPPLPADLNILELGQVKGGEAICDDGNDDDGDGDIDCDDTDCAGDPACSSCAVADFEGKFDDRSDLFRILQANDYPFISGPPGLFADSYYANTPNTTALGMRKGVPEGTFCDDCTLVSTPAPSGEIFSRSFSRNVPGFLLIEFAYPVRSVSFFYAGLNGIQVVAEALDASGNIVDSTTPLDSLVNNGTGIYEWRQATLVDSGASIVALNIVSLTPNTNIDWFFDDIEVCK